VVYIEEGSIMGKVVYSYYCMDIVHDGHLEMLRNCRRIAGNDGILVVGILTDEAIMEKKPRPTLDFAQRYRLARSLADIDLVVTQTTYSPLPNVKKIKPDILMESGSHTDEAIQEARDVMAVLGGKVLVVPYYPEQSSTAIKNRIKEAS
jgi:phosphoenolpyruvate phosphomutase